MLGIIEQVLINKYGQSLIDISEIKLFFSNLKITEKREYLEYIVFLIIQSKPNDNDIMEAIDQSKLKSTYTPCVLLKKGVSKSNLEKIINLTDYEIDKALILLLSLFKIAYSRKFLEEKNNQDKWWYWDLSDSNTVDIIINNYR